MPLTEYQAIQKVNTVLAQGGTDYQVSQIRTAPWGWIVYTKPFKQEQVMYGSSAYFLVHKCGIIKEQNDIAWRHQVKRDDVNMIVEKFLKDVAHAQSVQGNSIYNA
jgi:hypothetical protein